MQGIFLERSAKYKREIERQGAEKGIVVLFSILSI